MLSRDETRNRTKLTKGSAAAIIIIVDNSIGLIVIYLASHCTVSQWIVNQQSWERTHFYNEGLHFSQSKHAAMNWKGGRMHFLKATVQRSFVHRLCRCPWLDPQSNHMRVETRSNNKADSSSAPITHQIPIWNARQNAGVECAVDFVPIKGCVRLEAGLRQLAVASQ